LPIFELSPHGASARTVMVEHALVWILDEAMIYYRRITSLEGYR
jgi:hypothetical protein